MKCSNTEYNGSPWEWRHLGVVDRGNGGRSPMMPMFLSYIDGNITLLLEAVLMKNRCGSGIDEKVTT